jgi:hypothetical protein
MSLPRVLPRSAGYVLRMAPTYGKPLLYLTPERLVVHADVIGRDVEELGPNHSLLR